MDPNGTSGGLTLYYNKEYYDKILYSSKRMVDVKAVILRFLTFVYGEPVKKLRDQVWERLMKYGLVRSDPWFVIGNLNEITSNHEKYGGPLRNAGSFMDFNNMMRNCGLMEFLVRRN